ncbi:serine hydrolase [Nocardia sp. NPDC004722]
MVDGGDVNGGQIADGELVESGCHGTVLLEPIDPSLDRIAIAVDLGVERGWPPARRATAGELISTGADVNRFFTALLAGKLLASAQLEEMQQDPQPLTNRPGYSNGLGLARVPAICNLEVWGHGSSVPGFRTFSGVTPKGLAVTVSANLRSEDPAVTATINQAFNAALCAED